MPSVSKKQHNLMEAVAHNPKFAKRVGISQSVGQHFHEADMKKKHKFADGGHVKPNKLKGEAKETKSIAKEEMKALERGHAPKKILEHERAEHKAMGYKHGGVTHHNKMAKGGSAKHKSHSRRPSMPDMGGMGGMDPATLAALSGPPGGGAGPMAAGPGAAPGMPPAAPGMKRGGKIHHHSGHGGVHHHHHYAKGGEISTPLKKVETEKILKRHPSKHERDGAAVRGKTKGKVVRMAHGGHVSSASRRADGCATKGKTRA